MNKPYFVAITFPKILVCSNSMHSRYKLEVFYSQLNATMIEKFYGNYDEINGFKKQEILNLIKLNVRFKAKVLFLTKIPIV